jgi:hypothetical protein
MRPHRTRFKLVCPARRFLMPGKYGTYVSRVSTWVLRCPLLPPISVLLRRSREESYFNSTSLGIDIQLRPLNNFKFSHDITKNRDVGKNWSNNTILCMVNQR